MERDFEGMVSTSNPTSNLDHATDARHHNSTAEALSFYQVVQEQMRSESRTAKETDADGKGLILAGKPTAQIATIGKILIHNSSEVTYEYDWKHS